MELIQWLSSLEDKKILQSLFFYKDIQQKADWWDELSEEQLKEINKGILDIKALENIGFVCYKIGSGITV